MKTPSLAVSLSPPSADHGADPNSARRRPNPRSGDDGVPPEPRYRVGRHHCAIPTAPTLTAGTVELLGSVGRAALARPGTLRAQAMKSFPYAALALTFISSSAWAAPPSLSADRPGFSDSTWAVPFGHIALETGIGFGGVFDDIGGSVIALPEARIRIGLPGPFEAIINAPSLVLVSEGNDNVGASDLSLGGKVALDLGSSTSFSTLVLLTVPTGSGPGEGSDEVAGTLGLNFDFQGGGDLTYTAAGYLGFADSALQAGLGGLISLSLGKFGVFGELFVTRDAASEGNVDVQTWSLGVGGGATYMPTSRTQFDVFFDLIPWSETEVSTDAGSANSGNQVGYQAGLGFSILF